MNPSQRPSRSGSRWTPSRLCGVYVRDLPAQGAAGDGARGSPCSGRHGDGGSRTIRGTVRVFGCTPRYGASRSAMVFDAQTWAHSSQGADPSLSALLEGHAAKLLSAVGRRPGDVVVQASEAVDGLGVGASLAEVARVMGSPHERSSGGSRRRAPRSWGLECKRAGAGGSTSAGRSRAFGGGGWVHARVFRPQRVHACVQTMDPGDAQRPPQTAGGARAGAV